MSENRNRDKKDGVLSIRVGDELGISDVLTIRPSDITVTAYLEDGQEHNIVFPQDVSSDGIAQSLSEVFRIPGDATASFQEQIVESVELARKGPMEFKIDISLPLNKFFPWLRGLVSLHLKRGETTTYKKSTTKIQLPKSDEAGGY